MAAYGRAIWNLEAIHVCHLHRSRLIECRPIVASQPGDFACDVEANWPSFQEAARHGAIVEPSPLELHVIERLQRGRDQTAFGDVELHALVKFCELAGGLDLRGGAFRRSSMSREDWRRAGGVGFEIIAGGRAGVAKFVRRRWRAHSHDGDIDKRVRAMFGALDLWLRGRRGEVGKLRAMMFEAVTETIPVGPGDVVFGLPVGSRRIHSVETARRQLGIAPDRLRRLLAATMVLPPDGDYLSDDICTFDAVAHNALLGKIANTMSFRDVCAHLTAQPRQVRELLDRGLILPFISDPAGCVDGHAFAKDALAEFLRRLTVGAVHRPTYASPISNICDASRAANVGMADLIAAMLDGRLKWRGRSDATRRFDTILVNVDEIRWVFSRRKRNAVPAARR